MTKKKKVTQDIYDNDRYLQSLTDIYFIMSKELLAAMLYLSVCTNSGDIPNEEFKEKTKMLYKDLCKLRLRLKKNYGITL